MPKRYIKFDNFGGGQSESKYLGPKGSYAYGRELDHTDPAILRPNYDMDSDNTGTVGAGSEIRGIVKASDGNIYAIGDDGSNHDRLFKKTAVDNDWSTEATGSDGTGNGGLIEYDDYLYFYDVSDDISRYGPLSGSASLTENWQTGQDAEGHMFVSGDKLYFANKNYVSSWDGTTFTAAALDLESNAWISCLSEWRNYLVIGVYFTGGTRRSKIFFWDKSSSSWNDVVDIPDKGELVLYNLNQTLYITSVPNVGDINLYSWRGGLVNKEITLFRNVDYTVDARPESIDAHNGELYFGFHLSGGLGEENSGVYAFKPKSGVTQKAIYMPFGTHLNTLSYIGFKCIKWIDNRLHTSIYDGDNDNYYVNISDGNEYYSDNSTWESLKVKPNDAFGKSRVRRIQVNSYPLPSNCSYTIKYKLDDAASWTTAFTVDTQNSTGEIHHINSSSFKEIELAIDFNSYHDTRAEVTNLIVEFETTKEL